MHYQMLLLDLCSLGKIPFFEKQIRPKYLGYTF